VANTNVIAETKNNPTKTLPAIRIVNLSTILPLIILPKVAPTPKAIMQHPATVFKSYFDTLSGINFVSSAEEIPNAIPTANIIGITGAILGKK